MLFSARVYQWFHYHLNRIFWKRGKWREYLWKIDTDRKHFSHSVTYRQSARNSWKSIVDDPSRSNMPVEKKEIPWIVSSSIEQKSCRSICTNHHGFFSLNVISFFLPNDVSAFRNSFLSIEPLWSSSNPRKTFSHCVIKFQRDLNSLKSIVDDVSLSNIPENIFLILVSNHIRPLIILLVSFIRLTNHHTNSFLQWNNEHQFHHCQKESYRIEWTPCTIWKSWLKFIRCYRTWSITINPKQMFDWNK